MKNKKKARIDTYNTIYDMDVVVANELVTLKKLRELFEYTDGKELEELYTNYQGYILVPYLLYTHCL